MLMITEAILHLTAVNYGKTTCLHLLYPNPQYKCAWAGELTCWTILNYIWGRKRQFRDCPQEQMHIPCKHQCSMRALLGSQVVTGGWYSPAGRQRCCRNQAVMLQEQAVMLLQEPARAGSHSRACAGHSWGHSSLPAQMCQTEAAAKFAVPVPPFPALSSILPHSGWLQTVSTAVSPFFLSGKRQGALQRAAVYPTQSQTSPPHDPKPLLTAPQPSSVTNRPQQALGKQLVNILLLFSPGF